MDPKRTLSEISHLFLSDVRERQGGGPRPLRVPPPPRMDASIDMTPEEFATSLEADPNQLDTDARPAPRDGGASVRVVLSSHLGDHCGQRVRQYARHVAAEAGRVGMIETDGSEFGLTCFEPRGGQAAAPVVVDELDGRRMAETLAELSFDVDRWIISLPNPRTAEARQILQASPHWVLLTTANHDGVVATYRMLKGLAELGKPRLSLVVLDARDEAQAAAVFRKLDAVSRQFLGCRMESEASVQPVQDVTEHVLLHCRATKDKAQLAMAPQWKIVSDFITRTLASDARGQESHPAENMKYHVPVEDAAEAASGAHVAAVPTSARFAARDESVSQVIELPDDGAEGSILDAIVRQGGAEGQWVQCPIHPPMCPRAILAVGRDHRLILLALAGRGLTQLRAIGLALRWMSGNGDLIRMALPQLAIDSSGEPAVRLLVDHADLSADILQPLLQSETVTVQAYRRLKWGARTGLLLEAA